MIHSAVKKAVRLAANFKFAGTFFAELRKLLEINVPNFLQYAAI